MGFNPLDWADGYLQIEEKRKLINKISQELVGSGKKDTITVGKTGEEYMGFNPTEEEVDEFNNTKAGGVFMIPKGVKNTADYIEPFKKVNEFNWNNNMKVPREFGEANQTFDDDYVRPSSKQIGGSHYKDYSIQPWDIIDCYGLDFYEGNVLKYLLRTKGDRMEDLQKAKHYLDKIIEEFDCGR